MGTLKEYQCNGCGYTVTGTRKGRTLVMSGEIETEKVPRKCPKCGGDMKETGTVIMIDYVTSLCIKHRGRIPAPPILLLTN